MTTAARRTEHDVVGWRFRFFGAVYRCTSYDPSCGYWMELLEPAPEDPATPRYTPGWRTCISERAPGRTYHRIRQDDEEPAAHADRCLCYVCRPVLDLQG